MKLALIDNFEVAHMRKMSVSNAVPRRHHDEGFLASLDIHSNIVMALAYYSIELRLCLMMHDEKSFKIVSRLVKKQIVQISAKLGLGVNAQADMSDGELVIALFKLLSAQMGRLSEFIQNKQTPSGARVTREHARLMRTDIEKLQLAVRCLSSIARKRELTDALRVLKAAEAPRK